MRLLLALTLLIALGAVSEPAPAVDPTQPWTGAPVVVATPRVTKPSPQLTAIFTDRHRLLAVVDDRVVRRGGSVGTWRVASIDARCVVLERDRATRELCLPRPPRVAVPHTATGGS